MLRNSHKNLGGLLWMRQWTFGFCEKTGSYWLAEKLLVSQEELSSMELAG